MIDKNLKVILQVSGGMRSSARLSPKNLHSDITDSCCWEPRGDNNDKVGNESPKMIKYSVVCDLVTVNYGLWMKKLDSFDSDSFDKKTPTLLNIIDNFDVRPLLLQEM